MADNVAVTAGAGTTIAADEVVDGTLGTVKVQFVKLMDGTLDGTAKATVKAASTAPVATDPALVVAISPNSVNANGQATMANSAPVALASNQTYPTGMSPKAFSAAFSTLTRAANATPYTALDSISDNATPGSVTALTATVSDTNSDLLTLTEILVSSTDTGLAGKKIRAYLYNSDPTASTGVPDRCIRSKRWRAASRMASFWSLPASVPQRPTTPWLWQCYS